MGAAAVADNFDFTPGAQVPLMGTAGQTAATYALASAAYRDNEIAEILKANNDWHKSTVKPGRKWATIFRPNLGEAFSLAVRDRMVGAGRKPLIQSFGMEPQVVVEHCLAANNIRRERDNWLSAVMVLCGLLFLPGLLVWLLVFQIRTTVAKRDKRAGALGTTLLVAVGALAVIFLLRMPFDGIWAWYARACVVLPVVGWFWAKQICERAATDLRDRWSGLLAGGGVGAKIPEAVPGSPNETKAEQLRKELARLSAEQRSNLVFYAGPKGILGMGTRWGAWQLAEDLVAADSGKEIHPFRSWDVIRAIHDQLRMLERTPSTPVVSRRLRSSTGSSAPSARAPTPWPGPTAPTWTPTSTRTTPYRRSATSSTSAAATGTTWASSGRSGTAS